MYRPNGIAVVTAGLAGLVVVQRHLGPGPASRDSAQPTHAVTRAALDFRHDLSAAFGGLAREAGPASKGGTGKDACRAARAGRASRRGARGRNGTRPEHGVNAADSGSGARHGFTHRSSRLRHLSRAASGQRPYPADTTTCRRRAHGTGGSRGPRAPAPAAQPDQPAPRRVIAPPRPKPLRQAKTSSVPRSSSSSTEKAPDRGAIRSRCGD